MKKQRCEEQTRASLSLRKSRPLYGRIFMVLLFLLFSQQGFAQFRVIGYVPTWAGNLNEVQYTKLTHINYAFLIPTATGGYQGLDGNRLSTLVSLAHAKGVKVIISVGGGGGGDAFHSIVANAGYRTAFVNNMMNFVNQYNLDGVDIDWEYPGSGTEANNFALMMQELYNKMHSNGKLCTAAVIAYGGSSITNAVFNAVDFLNIMAYDENSYTHSTYELGVQSVNYWIGRGLPANKTVLGVPFYGRDKCCAYKTAGYNEILAMGGSPNSDTFNNQIGYNGIPTMKKKTAYAMQACSGIMIWSLDTDVTGPNSLLSAVNEVVVANSNPVPDNLAKGKSVTASSTESNPNVSTSASNATDGSYNTRWSSSFSDPQWFSVDLGGQFSINRVKLSWEAAYAKAYTVELSANGSDWITLKTITNNATTTNDLTGLSGTGRFIKVTGTTRATTYGYSLYEIEVYGTAIESPYNGTEIALPGKIEVENYDLGGEGLAYHDNESANQGGAYRTNEGVDVQATTDTGGGYNVGYTADGEWMKYMVNVTETGNYNFAFRTASTGSSGKIRLEVDGADVSGSIALPNTGAWQTWATTTVSNIPLSKGNHILRLYTVTGGFNLNYVTATLPTVITETPYGGTRWSLPGTVQAENYNNGGEGLAYHDIEASNQGGAYRTSEGVDVQATSDAGGGYNVGYTADGEWMQYMVNATAGTYDVSFRTAGTGSAGTIRMEVDGQDVTGNVLLPNTGGWQNWATTTVKNVSLTAGAHTIRLVTVTGGFNLNYFSVSVPSSSTMSFLRASGKNIVNDNGNFQIKAANLGNFMVQEGYMLNLGGGYQHNIKAKIAEVVGTANRDKFYQDYLANFITKADIDSLGKFGFNAIRLPMHYNLFTPLGQPDTYIESGFVLVDNIVNWCKANNMYVILDLHAAPGGQSSGDISDYVAGQPSLWESAANRAQTVKLWRKFAERYANETAVGGYDLINETNWTLANNNALLAQLMKDITAAIRQVDNNHIVFIEGNSYANDYNGLTPKWDNNMVYSFHKYWNDPSQSSLNFVLAIRDGQNVPIWLGEFGENSNHWLAESVSIMNNNNIGWAIWPYKKMSSVSSIGSFKQPANWSALAGYINGGSKPSAATGQAVLDELIENIKVKNCTFNKGYLYALFQQPNNNTTVPFRTVNLPGKVLAANYDEGKNGYAYNDAAFQNTQYGSSSGSSTSWNTGWYYRNDGVDLQYSSAENGPTIGWTETNDWMNYTVLVSTSASYVAKVRMAGNGGKMTLAVDGNVVLNNVTLPATGGWDNWQTVTLGNISLTSGKHTLRATVSTAGYNISYFDFSTSAPVNQAPVTALTAPSNDAAFDAPAAVTLTATATDADGTVSKVEFYNGTTLIGSDATAPYNVVWNAATAGTYTLTAKATDNNGATGTSAPVIVTVNAGGPENQAPTVTLTSPANNSTMDAPATLSLSANATDADGNVSKVEFYNGTTLLGSDASAPYSYSWSNVPAGTYVLTAKATDNDGATAVSVSVTVKVNPVTVSNPCASIANYVENNGYVAGSKVKNAGSQYQCKAWPYSGWCNGAAWAYAPGSGAYWTDAWTLTGSCSAGSRAENQSSTNDQFLSNYPNPFASMTSIEVQVEEAGPVTVKVYDKTGRELLTVVREYLAPGTYTYPVSTANWNADVYLVTYTSNDQVYTRKMVKTE